MAGLINWREVQKLAQGQMFRVHEPDQREMWGNSAEMYDGMAKLETEYTKNQVHQMILTAGDTVVDVGCGPGRLTVPIAMCVKSVTAVDLSPKMLARCLKNAEQAGLHNVVPMELDWTKEGAENEVGMHDIVLASRSVGFHDLIKLNKIAKKYVYLMGWANAPSLREIQLGFLEGVTEERMRPGPGNRMFGYNIQFNLLYDLGVEPNVVIVEDGFTRDYRTREDAYEDLRFVGAVPPDKIARYRANVDAALQEIEGGVRLLRKTKTYVMWWEPRPMVP